jgi:type VII secretion-associated serine protease mycosin/type VII secretion protein EccB
MATKKDLIEAQGFSRRRLLTAFTSGAPGGTELEPAKPLRAVVAGVALAAIVVLAGVFYGLVRPGLPSGWENNALILVSDTGARYVSQDGTLHPVLNTASARLLMPAGEYRVITTDRDAIAGIPVAGTVGILGAPDDLPAPDDLAADGWTACAVDDGTALSIGGLPLAAAAAGGAVVVRGDDRFVVAGGVRYAVDAAAAAPVLRAAGLDATTETEVDGRWLNLFAPGAELAPLVVPGAGDTIAGSPYPAGTAVHPEGSPEEERYLITADGELARLTPLAYQLYLLGSGAELGAAIDVAPAELAGLPTATERAGGADWPTEPLAPLPSGQTPCALLGHDDAGVERTVLAGADASAELPPTGDAVHVAVDSGALVRTGAAGGLVHLVDATGTSFAVPGADPDILGRLGYSADDVTAVSTAWLQFLPAGPELTVEAAGSSPAAATDARAAECRPGDAELTLDVPPALDLLDAEAVARLATGAGVTVAVVDSGVDAGNPHLQGAVVGGVDLVGDGEGAGGLADPLGHGTAVAGAIAARPIAESGVVGLAPDARLLSVRVFRGTDQQSLDAGFGPRADRIAAGIRWAVDHGAQIVNVSLSINADVAEVRDAVAYAASRGALVVASAGNRASTEDTSDSPRYPAANPGALAVTATDSRGVVTDDSIHGPHVELAAPGTDVLTAATGGGDCVFATEGAASSFATAYASAAAALVAQAHPAETPGQWEYRLQVTADRDDPDARDDLDGWGMLRPAAAIELLPDPSLRGPVSPFFDAAGAPVTTAPEHLVPDHSASPFDATRDALGLTAIGGGGILAVLGALAVFRVRRNRPEQPETPRPVGGLLDRPTTPF